MDKSLFKIAAQSGGGKESDKFEPLFWFFKRTIQKHFNDYVNEQIQELSFVFRIDGEFSNWGIKGCNRLRLKKSKKCITIDIGITSEVLAKEDTEINQFILNEFFKGLELMNKRLLKEKINLDFERIYSELNTLRPLFNVQQ